MSPERSQTVLASLSFSLLLGGVAVAAPAPGQKVFLDQKCNQCHFVSSQKIELAGKPEEGIKPHDLWKVGAEQKPEWMKAFLLKKEAKAGVKHKRKFQGTPAELQQVVDWLATLK